MKLFVLSLALSCAPVAAAQAGPGGQPVNIGTSYRIAAPALGDEREINVWLPPGYARSRDRYPVVYLVDGGLDQDFHPIAGLGSLASLSWTFGPFIVVSIQTRERRAELTARPIDPRYLSAFPESGGAARFPRFLREGGVPPEVR